MCAAVKRLVLLVIIAALFNWQSSAGCMAPDQKPADQKASDENATKQSQAYSAWTSSGSIFLLTTPDGADLPATARLEGFPLLVPLHSDFFDFEQAKSDGADVRFSTVDGEPLPYQIEEWNPQNGLASIWVRIPVIEGNARQEIKLHWGKPDAVSESNGKAVFNKSNGYLSVWHMDATVSDSAGMLKSVDNDTTATVGVVGSARHLAGQQGIACGEAITGFPTGSKSHSSEAWFRAERPNSSVMAWGNEEAQGKVVMNFRSPPHITMDCYFSDANVSGQGKVPLSQWQHVVHTYEKGDSRIYINGVMDGQSLRDANPLRIKRPCKMWIGGWYNNYEFVGDIDEVRVSQVARSADWIKLEYENQKPNQTLVGPVVTPGNRFEVSSQQLTVDEGARATVKAAADGAQKIFWIVADQGTETVVATDRLTYSIDAGRVTDDKSFTLLLKAIYPDEVRVQKIAISVRNSIPEPIVTLNAPKRWDGRQAIEVTPEISNLAELQAAGADKVNMTWTCDDIAVIKQAEDGRLKLMRAQNSGVLKVTLAIDNGGATTIASTTINVSEPAFDEWVQRIPEHDEQPADRQFYARDDKNEGTLFYSGTLAAPVDSVFLKVYADDKLYVTETGQPTADQRYSLKATLKPGLVKYRTEFGSKVGDHETVLHTASNLICGDAFLIDGQSNAEATDVGEKDPEFQSDWIRSFGSAAGNPESARLKLWTNAVVRDRDGGKGQIGYWGMELAKRLLERHKIPVCIINGAVGGSRIDVHQRNPSDPNDVSTIYGRILWRVQQARLTNGIRAVLWHQGENDQGADGPTGGFGWETYRQYFVEMSGAWKQDFPNIQNYYTFQIWPKACAMGFDGSDDQLREVQRTLPRLYSNLDVMSTLGIKPPGGCHYPIEGYAEFARLIAPLVERDHYGVKAAASIAAPNLINATFTSDERNEICLSFDDSVVWTQSLASQFYLDGEGSRQE